jgi:FMN phosphatase YigB (HAD superfamily)
MHSSITAPELPDLIDTLPARIKALSLDCFDTLFWRKVARPVDVFFALQDTPLWKEAGVTATLRVKAEENARMLHRVAFGTREVSIEAIYRELLGTDDPVVIERWVATEIAAETEHGFLYEPILGLIRRARARGLRVFIVSDIYYSSRQLGALLESVMGADVRLIDRIHCSSEYARLKSDGLWEPVLRKERLRPSQVFHLGDNPEADYKGPIRHGIEARHLRNLPEAIAPLCEAREQAATQLMPEVRSSFGLPSAYHAQWAAHGHGIDGVARRIGYFVLGPIFHAFSVFVRDRLDRLAERGRPVKYAFLLRDGYLPARAFAAFCGQEQCPQIQISRFTAQAASLRTREDVLRLLSKRLNASNMEIIAAQLMLPPEAAKDIVGRARREGRPAEAFCRLVMRQDNLEKVLLGARRIRASLIEHVRTRTDLRRGDTLALIDLGYSGTVQTSLSAVFRDEVDVDLQGIYLIASRTSARQTDRCGLVGPDWADERLIVALTAYIGSFEMMCTKAEPSVMDYTPEGEPVSGAVGIKGQQTESVRQMQEACLNFVADVLATPAQCRPRMTLPELARQVVADLGRLIYLPDRDEIVCQAGFKFDFNLGTDLMLSIADLEGGMRQFRREGFAMMEQAGRSKLDDMRISYPMEARYMDISLATTLMAAQRYAFAVKPSQASYRQETIPVLVADGTSHSQVEAHAQASHDGFFVMSLPLSPNFSTAVLWGHRYEWLQIDSIEKVLLADARDRRMLTIGEDVILDGVDQAAQDLLRCSSQGMLFIPPCPAADDRRYRIQVVFRPIALRALDTAPVAAPSEPCMDQA